ncbi:MAG: amino acid adenylation domain-containing protein [Flavobacteriales bacterium]|nr:amino acid adenylation domain-containing protein [Flavobacteriales bacterium]
MKLKYAKENLDNFTSSEKVESALSTQIDEWNNTQYKYYKEKYIHKIFEELADVNKDRIALVYEDQQITYEILNKKANQLAHYLKRNFGGNETLIGISVPRSLELIIGLLGILKSGGVYVPLDPEYPKDRLEYMVEDAGIEVLLTTKKLASQWKGYNGKIICLDSTEFSTEPTYNLDVKIFPDNLAYIIYTSGSTGKPKGAGILHHALINRLEWQQMAYNLKTTDVILHKSSIGFDVSIWELLWSYIAGCKLVVTPLSIQKDLDGLLLCIKKQQITTTHFVPSLLDLFLSNQNDYPMQFVICSGEALTPKIYSKFNTKYPQTKVYNLYGPTEATIDVTHYTCMGKEKFENIPIGTPIYNTQIYILDEFLTPVPLGGEGEIYIGGVGLARGYLNRPSLTAEKFIPNPFAKGEMVGSRLYKTGDLGRYLPNGNIEFLGRIDHQVKIRGFRIELGEIESIIQNVKGIKQCVVLAREDVEDQKKLVGYIVVENNGNKNEIIKQCRELCKSKLPDYMQPSQIMILEGIPLTSSGKVDRKALPIPKGREGLDIYEGPIGQLEEQLVNIWKNILKIDKIGRNDSFFILGGSSLTLMAVRAEIIDIYNVNVPLHFLFNNPFVQALAKKIEKLSENKNEDLNSRIIPVPRDREIPLTFQQKICLEASKQKEGNILFNEPYLFRCQGLFNIDAFQQSINLLFERNEIFRSTINVKNETLTIHEKVNPYIEHHDWREISTSLTQENACALVLKHSAIPCNIEDGPLLKFIVIRLSEDSHYLGIIIHHIINDGESQALLINELKNIYKHILGNQSLSNLPETFVQYPDYCHWQNHFYVNGGYEPTLLFWEKKLSHANEQNILKLDYQRRTHQLYEGDNEQIVLSEEITECLKKYATEQGVTLFTVLFTIFSILISSNSSVKDITIYTPVANREKKELRNMLGFFANRVFLRVNLEKNMQFSKLLKRVFEIIIEGFEHQDYPWNDMMERVNSNRSNLFPLVQASFAFQNVSSEHSCPFTFSENVILEPININRRMALSEFRLEIFELGKTLKCIFEYNTNLFKLQTVKKLIKNFQIIIKEVLEDPNQYLNDLMEKN